jgi:hypothetical protein
MNPAPVVPEDIRPGGEPDTAEDSPERVEMEDRMREIRMRGRAERRNHPCYGCTNPTREDPGPCKAVYTHSTCFEAEKACPYPAKSV